MPKGNDNILNQRIRDSVFLAEEKHKALNVPIVRFDPSTGEIFHEMSNGSKVKVSSGSRKGRYSERKKRIKT